jgi:7,8-dihydropterin-6-yl-methyl-4-(beta-D-ribofuranosyl)aminobenzene 5'-phosphate synthase
VESIALAPVDSLSVTVLVDNVMDLLLGDRGPAKRAPVSLTGPPSAPSRFLEGGRTGEALRAEHGFGCLVTATRRGRSVRVLFDAGRSPDALVHNMRLLELSPGDIDVVVLSHGHWDHAGGMHGLAEALGRPNLPVLIHPEFWSRRRITLPGREPMEPPSTSRHALASRFPDAFIQTSVGTRFAFGETA